MVDRERTRGTGRKSRASRASTRLLGIASLELDDEGIVVSNPFDAKNSADTKLVRTIERTFKKIDQPALEARLREQGGRVLIASDPSLEGRYLADDLLPVLGGFLGRERLERGESLAFGMCIMICINENDLSEINLSEKDALDLFDRASIARESSAQDERPTALGRFALPGRPALPSEDLLTALAPEEREAFALIGRRLGEDPSNNGERLIALHRLLRSLGGKPPSGVAQGPEEVPTRRANPTGREPVGDGGMPGGPGPTGSEPVAPRSEIEEVLDIGRSLCDEFDAVNLPRIPRVQSFLDRLASVDFQETSRETRDETVRVVKDLISRAGAVEVFCYDSDDKDQPWKLATEILCVTSSARSRGAFRFRDRDREEIHKRIDWPPCRIEPVGSPTRS